MRTGSGARITPAFEIEPGLGDLLVLRDAGNTLNDPVAGGRTSGRIATILVAIRPAVRETRHQAGGKTDNAVRGHARRAAQTLAATGPIIAHAVQSGPIKIFAARYDLASGRSDLLPPSRAWRSVSRGKRPRISPPASPWPRGPIAACRPEPGALPRTRRSRKAGSPPTGPAPTFTRR